MCTCAHLSQLQPLGHGLQTLLARALHRQRAFDHVAVQQADPRHKVVLAQDVVAPRAPQLQPEGHGWLGLGPRGVKGQKSVGSEREGGERGGRGAGGGGGGRRSTTRPLPSSLSHDASHTTGRRDAPWQGAGPFPTVSVEEGGG